MKSKISIIVIFGLLTVLILTGCTSSVGADLEEELEAKNNIIKTLEEENIALEKRISELEAVENPIDNGDSSNSLISTALEVVALLENEDMASLSTYIHPTMGLRFSPYGYIDVQNSQVFTSSEIPNLMEDSEIYTWGSYDGTGDAIELNFDEYFDKFVYDEDFVNPHIIGNNHIIGTGNTLNNINAVFTNGEFVEFHFTGFDTQYEGIDWKSLKLVFEQDNDNWFLVAIVHDQWTI